MFRIGVTDELKFFLFTFISLLGRTNSAHLIFGDLSRFEVKSLTGPALVLYAGKKVNYAHVETNETVRTYSITVHLKKM